MAEQELPPSSLFRLPRHVRTEIYKHALTTPEPILWPTAGITHGLSPALLRTARAVYREAAPVLYARNRLQFAHPSDANVFVHIMDATHVAEIRAVSLRVVDRDLRLWTGYLGSGSTVRSLQCDFPRLRSLVVVLRGASLWHTLDGDVLANLPRWVSDPKLRELCLSLHDRITAADVKVVCLYRVARGDLAGLVQAHPQTLSANQAGVVRSAFTKAYDFDVALELTPIDPPHA